MGPKGTNGAGWGSGARRLLRTRRRRTHLSPPLSSLFLSYTRAGRPHLQPLDFCDDLHHQSLRFLRHELVLPGADALQSGLTHGRPQLQLDCFRIGVRWDVAVLGRASRVACSAHEDGNGPSRVFPIWSFHAVAGEVRREAHRRGLAKETKHMMHTYIYVSSPSFPLGSGSGSRSTTLVAGRWLFLACIQPC